MALDNGMTVACPQCLALPWAFCTDREGRIIRFTHAARIEREDERELASRTPTGDNE